MKLPLRIRIVPDKRSRVLWRPVVVLGEAFTRDATRIVLTHVGWITRIRDTAALIFILPGLWTIGVRVHNVATIRVTGWAG